MVFITPRASVHVALCFENDIDLNLLNDIELDDLTSSFESSLKA